MAKMRLVDIIAAEDRKAELAGTEEIILRDAAQQVKTRVSDVADYTLGRAGVVGATLFAAENSEEAAAAIPAVATAVALAASVGQAGGLCPLDETAKVPSARLPSFDTTALDDAVDAMSAKLPATLGQHASAGSLSIILASDQSAIDVNATPAQVYFEGTATLTRPAGALTYTAGNALYSSATPAAAPSVTLNNAATGAAIATGSVLVITGVQVHASTPTPTVLPFLDVLVSPITFTAVADNAAWAPPVARLQDGAVLTTEQGMACGASGAVSWSYDGAARIKLAAGSSALHFQPRFRLAYVASDAESFVFRFSGYVVL